MHDVYDNANQQLNTHLHAGDVAFKRSLRELHTAARLRHEK
jgi:hypothetical protein